MNKRKSAHSLPSPFLHTYIHTPRPPPKAILTTHITPSTNLPPSLHFPFPVSAPPSSRTFTEIAISPASASSWRCLFLHLVLHLPRPASRLWEKGREAGRLLNDGGSHADHHFAFTAATNNTTNTTTARVERSGARAVASSHMCFH